MSRTDRSRSQQGVSRKVGRYQIVERIGRGAMGVVYRARDEAMDRDVAVKILAPDLEDEPEIRLRFHREAETAARLSHPNIITIFDLGEEDGHFHLVMEFLNGATLKEHLSQTVLSTASKVDLMIQLSAGLGAAHRAGICHRDIKPGNVFVRSDGVLKILDFGIARLANSGITTAGLVMGTPDFMSPEQARGEEIDGRSDIFSAGGVFYYMLTGRKPFAAQDMRTVFRRLEQDDPEAIRASEAPAELAAVVMKALAKKPDKRHSCAEELQDELIRVRETWGLAAPSLLAPPAFVQVAASQTGQETEDTVDWRPPSAIESDETVTWVPRSTWRQRVTRRMKVRTRLRRKG